MAVRNIKCSSCGAAMRFDPTIGKLKCDNCGTVQDITESTASEVWANIDESKVSWVDWGGFNPEANMQDEDGNTILYNCPSCGATIEVDVNTSASKCPYCDNNVVLKERVQGVKKPHALIPFKIDKEQVPNLLKDFFGKQKFLPKQFREGFKVENIKSVYVPHWLFDCELRGTMDFTADIVHTISTSDATVINTDHYLITRGGDLFFEKIPVDGSISLDDKLSQSVEPYHYSELVPYDDRYLSGFIAEVYDEDPETSMYKASDRMMVSAAEFLKSREHYVNVRLRSNDMKVSEANARYVLLPMYLFDTMYKGKHYRYAINGQTGKVVGERPVSYGRMVLRTGLISLGLGAAAFGATELLGVFMK